MAGNRSYSFKSGALSTQFLCPKDSAMSVSGDPRQQQIGATEK